MSVDSVTKFRSSISIPNTISKLWNCPSQHRWMRACSFLHRYKSWVYEHEHMSKVDRKHVICDNNAITKLHRVCNYDKYSTLIPYLEVWDHTTAQLNSNCTYWRTFQRVINRLIFIIIVQSIHNHLCVHINSSYQGHSIVICLQYICLPNKRNSQREIFSAWCPEQESILDLP